MGSFYANVTLLDVDLQSVVDSCTRPAFVVTDGPDVVLFAEADDPMATTTAALSSALGCTAVAMGVYDDDVLMWEIHAPGGRVVAGAVPDPEEYFDEGDGGTTETVDPAQLVTSLGRGDEPAVRAALEADFVFASERHEALARALALPTVGVGWGYRYLADEPGEMPAAQLVE